MARTKKQPVTETKLGYTDGADDISKEKRLEWFTRGVNDAKIYLAQVAGTTISQGYSHPETVWWIKLRQNEQALVEYERGFVSQAAKALE